MIMPAMTVSTKVTAPHSRRSTSQFTSAEFYWEYRTDRRRSEIVLAGGAAFLFLLLALVQEPDEVLRTREGFPTFRKEVLDQDLGVRLLVDGDAPFVEGARNFDLEVFLRGLIPNNLVVVEVSSSS